MLINCNSCQKKFTVPDSAITGSGRLLQCGSCGNKWTQYPIKETSVKEIKKATPSKTKKGTNLDEIKTSIKKKKREVNLYTDEYLRKKYGLVIKRSLGHQDKKKLIKSNFGCYNYLVTISIFVIALYGVLNLSKDVLIANYPVTEPYIKKIFESIDTIKLTISNFIN
jgi:predicted Zn finger-like uncharacterized protein